MDVRQAYRTLRLEDNASPDEVKNAYRRLALESHPDKSTDPDDTRFKMITEAYNLLKGRRGTGGGGGGTGAGAAAAAAGAGSRSPWGAPPRPPKGDPPEQDWGRFTKEYEEGDPDWWKEYEKRFWDRYDRTVNADGRNGEFEKAEEPPKQPDLQVGVDPSLCIGCCSCEIIAPGVFRIDRESQTNPKSRVINRRGAGINRIMNAAETCPTRAINVEDRKTRERLYPH